MGQDGGCCGGGQMKQDNNAGGGCCKVDSATASSANAACDAPSKSGGCGSGGCSCGGKCVCAAKPFASNIGQTERLFRIMVGVVLIALVFVGPKTPFGWIGVVPLATGIFGFCGLYRMCGISTYKRICCGKCKTA